MNLFQRYLPGTSWLHRLPVGWKYLLLLTLTVPALIAGQMWLSLASLAIGVVLVLSCGAGVRFGLALPLTFWVLVGVLAGYQLLAGRPDLAVVVGVNLVGAVYASRLLTLTTPGPVLIDALVAASRPLRRFGAEPEQIGLAVAVMVSALPWLLDSFTQVRQAALARGRDRNLFALVAPVVVRAVGRAQATGAALAARGLGEP